MQSSIFRSKQFLPLFITQFFGVFNDNAFKNAFLIWFTYDMAGRSTMNEATFVTIAAGVFMLPFFLFSATAGQCADKFEKSKLTQIIKIIEVVLMICAGIAFAIQSIIFLLLILFMMGTQSTFFGPIKYSLLPEHLAEKDLIKGNAWIEGGTFLSILLGTIAGAIIIRMPNGIEILSVMLIIFALVGKASSHYIPIAKIPDSSLIIGWNIVKETKKIIGFAQKERTVWLSIIAISWFWFIGVTFLTQFPMYCKNILMGDQFLVTLLLTVFSIGIGIGSMLCNILLRGKINGRLVPWGCFGITFAIFAFVFFSIRYVSFAQADMLHDVTVLFFMFETPWGIPIVLSLLSLSIFSGIYIVPLYAIMQHRSKAQYLSRVIAANNVMNALFMVLSSIIGAFLLDKGVGIIHLLAFVGICNIPIYFIIRDVVRKRLQDA